MKFSFFQRGLAIVAASACLTATAPAAPTVDVNGGEVIIQYTLSSDLSNLTFLTGKHPSGVKITGLDYAIKNRTLRLPIKGGALDVGPGNIFEPRGSCQYILGGGLVYTRTLPDKSVTKVTLSDFILDVTFNITTSGAPPLPTVTYGGSITALMAVNGQVVDRLLMWRLERVPGEYLNSLPIKSAYKKANFNLGNMIGLNADATPTTAATPTVGATALLNALGQPAGFDPTSTFGDVFVRTAFKPQ